MQLEDAVVAIITGMLVAHGRDAKEAASQAAEIVIASVEETSSRRRYERRWIEG